jgi:type IV pilus assembly protein PilB
MSTVRESTGPAPTPVTAPDHGADALVGLLQKEGLVADTQLRYATRVRAKLDSHVSLLKVLQDLDIIKPEHIRQAVRANPKSVRLGDLLIELGHLRDADLRAALAAQAAATERRKLGEILVESHFITEQKLTDVLADLLGIEAVEPRVSEIEPTLLARINLRMCQECVLIPVAERDGSVTVAFGDPLDARHRGVAEQMFGSALTAAIARPSLIREALAAYERGVRSISATVSEQTAMSIVNDIIRDALQAGASDIHIEPYKSRLRVRLRLDGVMVEHCDIDRDLAPSVTSRLKIMGNADIAERRRHQDGRIQFEDPQSGETADIRASFYVTVFGEKIVLRLLNRKTELISIDDIGMGPRMLDRFRYDALDVPTGVVIITGPTGSGKTTTLYSCVDYLNDPNTSIVTAEDPVEYVIDGIAQCSINPKINLTFEETLRHIVRQDPDIIVLGEIRDRFSADTAIQAALTGHKVLTTFHTEDSIGGLLRLLNMEIEAFLISSTVVSVVAQRLLRRVCRDCAEPYTPTAAEIRRLGCAAEDLQGAHFMFGRGCAACRYTGYKGRVCVFELLVLNEMVKDAILNRRTSYEIRRISVETSGLVTLVEDGLFKASLGITSLQEVLRDLPRVMKPRRIEEIRRLLGAV